MSESQYSADNITKLEGLDAVRKRPGMFIGSTNKQGLHHLVQELIDNSVDEAMTGNADEINVVIHEDNSVSVKDNGRGIPVDDKDGEPAVNMIMTDIHAGGKFDSEAYAMSGGLHGVGVSVVNALSDKLTTIIKRDGYVWKQVFEHGEPQGLEKERKLSDAEETGTYIRFWVSEEQFETSTYDFELIRSRLENLAYLNSGVKFTISDDREERTEEYYFEGGINEFVQRINEGREPLFDSIIRAKGEETLDNGNIVQADIAMQYTTSTQSDNSIFSFANNIETKSGGTHETGFKTAITRVVNKYAEENGMLEEINGQRLSGNIVREGLTAVISVRHSDPQFEGQTKTKLGNAKVRGVVSSVISAEFSKFLEEHPDAAETIVSKAINAYKAKQAAEKAEELTRRKSATTSTRLPGKLSDCQKGTKPEDAELFIVEGDSAGGCFTADTKVRLASGRDIRFDKLVEEHKKGKNHYVYTVDKSGKIKISNIKHPRITKRDADLVKVTLDNGEEIKCTPDHRFMLRNGEYKEAIELKESDSLMPLYTKKSDISEKNITIDGYEMVKQPNYNNFWEFTHILSDEYNLENNIYEESDGVDRHHIDFDKLNNCPENIIRLPKKEHQKIHAEHAREFLHTEEVKEKSRKTRHTEENGNTNILKLETTIEKFFEDKEELIQESEKYNHKVNSVERISEKADVYDLEVPETHNFALSSGVFVHNSTKQARNPENQAVLPLRGKILNVEKNRLNKILEHDQIQNIITALGTGIDDEFDIDDLRYHTIVLFVDADVDGAHIKTLLLTFLFRHMPELLENGHVYAAKSPLYRIKYNGNTYDAMTEAEREEIIENKCNGNPTNVQRFKGLGEMNPEQLWDATMNPETRRFERITINDAAQADRIFSVLMGSQVKPRRDFIRENAGKIEWEDIDI